MAGLWRGYLAARMANINSPSVRSKSNPLRNGSIQELSNCSRYWKYQGCSSPPPPPSRNDRPLSASIAVHLSPTSLGSCCTAAFKWPPLLSLASTYYRRISPALPQPPRTTNGNNLAKRRYSWSVSNLLLVNPPPSPSIVLQKLRQIF